jgi:anthranilate synthase/aminodeoxychorismate synthase-like glutamine amidotransferase
MSPPRADARRAGLHVILLLDHRDSFTFNLAQALQALGARVEVRPARGTSLATVRRLRPAKILLGPGPGRPEAAGLSLGVLRELAPSVPILGVCLGFQAIGIGLGGRVERAREPVHGRTVRVTHDGRGLFADLPSPLAFTRYNSLGVLEAGLPACLEISARAEDGDLMGLRHREWPLEGVQFHPESVLSEGGMELLGNFVRM